MPLRATTGSFGNRGGSFTSSFNSQGDAHAADADFSRGLPSCASSFRTTLPKSSLAAYVIEMQQLRLDYREQCHRRPPPMPKLLGSFTVTGVAPKEYHDRHEGHAYTAPTRADKEPLTQVVVGQVVDAPRSKARLRGRYRVRFISSQQASGTSIENLKTVSAYNRWKSLSKGSKSFGDAYVVYNVEVISPASEVWHIQTRYSKVRDLYRQLATRSSIGERLPPMPSKGIFRKKSADFLDERISELQHILDCALAKDPQAINAHLRRFLHARLPNEPVQSRTPSVASGDEPEPETVADAVYIDAREPEPVADAGENPAEDEHSEHSRAHRPRLSLDDMMLGGLRDLFVAGGTSPNDRDEIISSRVRAGSDSDLMSATSNIGRASHWPILLRTTVDTRSVGDSIRPAIVEEDPVVSVPYWWALFDSGFLTSCMFVVAMVFYVVGIPLQNSETNSTINAWRCSWLWFFGAALFLLESAIDLIWSVRRWRMEDQLSVDRKDLTAIDEDCAKPTSIIDLRQPLLAIEESSDQTEAPQRWAPWLDDVHWDFWASLFFALPSIFDTVAALLDPNVAWDHKDAADRCSEISAVLYVIDGLICILARISYTRQTPLDERLVCIQIWKLRGMHEFDWGLWGDVMMAVGSIGLCIQEFGDYHEWMDWTNQLLWLFVAIFYVIASWPAVRVMLKNRKVALDKRLKCIE